MWRFVIVKFKNLIRFRTKGFIDILFWHFVLVIYIDKNILEINKNTVTFSEFDSDDS